MEKIERKRVKGRVLERDRERERIREREKEIGIERVKGKR